MQNTVDKPQITVQKKKKKRASSLERIKARAGWGFILPFVIGFFVIYLPIIIESIYYSFTEIKVLPGGGFSADFVGLKNYSDALFVDPDYVRRLSTGLQGLLFDIPAIVIFALFMAILLNQKMMGRAAFRAIFFLPVVLSTGIIDRIDQGNQMLDYLSNTGNTVDPGARAGEATSSSAAMEIVSFMDFAFLFRSMRFIDPALITYVIQMVNNIFNIVNRSGVQMLIFLGGLQSISPVIYESAHMEGASMWEAFWKITFPMISPFILVNAIYTVIDSFTSRGNTIMSLIQAVYNEPGGNVLSSAMAWMYFLIVIGAMAIVGGIVSSFVFYQRRAD